MSQDIVWELSDMDDLSYDLSKISDEKSLSSISIKNIPVKASIKAPIKAPIKASIKVPIKAPIKDSNTKKLTSDPYDIFNKTNIEDIGLPTNIMALLESSCAWAISDVSASGYTLLANNHTEESKTKDEHSHPEQCLKCGGRQYVFEHEYRCTKCQFVTERDTTMMDYQNDDTAGKYPGRLRIVGPNSGHYQPDLDRSSSTNYAVTQRKQVYEEYLKLRQMHMESGGNAYPLNVLNLATDIYHEIQRLCTKRSQRKKSIMAFCLKIACVLKGFVPTIAEIAKFMQLTTKGTAGGENFIRKMKADGQINIDVNKDTCAPHICTIFALLGLDKPELLYLQTVVENIVRKSIKDAIGIASVIRSKAMGSTYVVLRRYAISSGTIPILLPEFCQKCMIRKNTATRVINQLADYHSHFKSIYTKAEIYDGVLD